MNPNIESAVQAKIFELVNKLRDRRLRAELPQQEAAPEGMPGEDADESDDMQALESMLEEE